MIFSSDVKGFSLISALVFTALITMVAVGIMSVVDESFQTVGSVNARIQQDLLQQAITNRLSQRNICTEVLGGKNFNFGQANDPAENGDVKIDLRDRGQSINDLDMRNYGIGRLIRGQDLEVYQLRVRELRLMDAVNRSAGVPGAPLRYTVKLYGQFSSTKDLLGPSTFQPILLADLAIRVSGGGGIQECEAIAPFPNVLCSIKFDERSDPSNMVYLPVIPPDDFQGRVSDGNDCIDFRAFGDRRTPPPKFSDFRLKKDLRVFEASESVKPTPMDMIRDLQKRQLAIEALRSEVKKLRDRSP